MNHALLWLKCCSVAARRATDSISDASIPALGPVVPMTAFSTATACPVSRIRILWGQVRVIMTLIAFHSTGYVQERLLFPYLLPGVLGIRPDIVSKFLFK